MIKQVSHTVAGTDPAGIALALDVAYALHAPAPRAPEVASPAVARRGAAAAHGRRRTVRG
jgi:orotate phosphoribosyltransferase